MLLVSAFENQTVIYLDIQATDKVTSMYWSNILNDKQRENIMSKVRMLPLIITNLKSLIVSRT